MDVDTVSQPTILMETGNDVISVVDEQKNKYNISSNQLMYPLHGNEEDDYSSRFFM